MSSNDESGTKAIIGRQRELAILEGLYHSAQAEFLAIYGRRRIGKTYLIRQYFKNKGYYFELTGAKNASRADQLSNFREAFADAFYNGVLQEKPTTWQAAFMQLRRKVETLDSKQKIILFLDELPWLASQKSGVLSSVEHVWNRYLSSLDNVILIVCGSTASWIIKNIINNRGGFYGRLTAQIHLQPFTLGETELYLQSRNITLDRKQVIELYFAFGGVAKYLSYIKRGKSAAQNITELCFDQYGALTSEFPKLYGSLFDDFQLHVAIVNVLARKHYGVTQHEIAAELKISTGGGVTKVLNELEGSGFILSVSVFGHKKKNKQYRLIDEYSLFYLTWIQPALENHLKKVATNYWQSIQNTPNYTTWAGYAFEGVCLKHVEKLVKALELTVVARSCTAWSYKPKHNDENNLEKGTQIDLVIDRSDKCINLCEIKFYNKPFQVTREHAENLQYKKECFLEQTKTKKTLFTTLIASYGAAVNEHYLSAVDEQITMDALF